MDFKSFGFSDTGKSRSHNEDKYLCNLEQRLFLLADGMGGHASGETASQLAISNVEDFIIRSRSDHTPRTRGVNKDLTIEQDRFMAAVTHANLQIYRAATQDSFLKGMGTTLVGATIEEEHLAIVNVGDSRLYRVRKGEILQITEDHSWVMEQVHKGILDQEDASKHPQRHVLTRALGVSEKCKMDVSLADIQQGDMFLFCSDGLYMMLEDREILSIISSIEDKSLYKIGLSLVLKANLAGGLDNITVILLTFS